MTVFKVYKIFQALSLDVVIGINIFTTAIGMYYGAFISWHILLGLSIAIWLIYTFDHLMDAKKIKGQPATYRHQFHRKNRKILFVTSSFLFILGLINMFYLPLVVVFSGLFLGFFTVIYFLLLQKSFFKAKEFWIAAIYTIGTFIAPVAMCFTHLNFVQLLLIPEVFFLALANLLIFSWYDVLKDKQNGQISLVTILGIPYIKTILNIIFVAGVLIGTINTILDPHFKTLIIQVIVLVMFGVLAFIYRYHRLFRHNDIYRIAGDGIFYLPMIYIIYAGKF